MENSFRRVKIVGAGLIGTSIALRLKEKGLFVSIIDINPTNEAIAKDLIQEADQSKSEERAPYDLIVIATPISVVPKVVLEETRANPESRVVDISGLMSKVINEVEAFPELSERFVSCHPMAGREVSGPQKARADLFEGRAWIVTKTRNSDRVTSQYAKQLGQLLGSTNYEMSAGEHDSAIAAISHLPQILSSLLGTSLLDLPEDVLNLSGQGLRDVSRLADSNPSIWTQLLLDNSEQLVPKLQTLSERFAKLIKGLERNDAQRVSNFISEGAEGRGRIPGKHGAKNRPYSYLPIVIDDKPGQLAKIFNDCSRANINIEDLLIEHSPGQETGLITLAIMQERAGELIDHLRSCGWKVHDQR
jgi:prephenate dehydrogenase